MKLPRVAMLMSLALLLPGDPVTPAGEPPGAANERENPSAWVYRGSDGTLVYKATSRGDRIMDFSHAGYMGGGVPLPDVPVIITVRPSGDGDDTQRIQNAIDEVAARPSTQGLRGTVLLAPGTFSCARTIYLSESGVVLSGSGSGPDGTTITMGGDQHCAIIIGSRGESPVAGRTGAARPERSKPTPVSTTVADPYVPSGAMTFSVRAAAGFAVGDIIRISRPTTAAWLKAIRMHDLRRDGRPQTFLPVGRTGSVERRITLIQGNRLAVDVPLSDSYDARLLDPPGTAVAAVSLPRRVTQAGIERIHIRCPPLEIKYSSAPYSAIRVGGDDCWVRDVYCEETMNSTAVTGNRVTFQRVVVTHTYPNLGASKPSDFSIQGCQILLDRCRATGGNTYFVWTGSLVSGPNVVLNGSFSGHGSRLQPHQRWATGLLIDNCRVPDGGIDYMNRGVAGSGHGWTMGWGVVWNCTAKSFIIQRPPGSVNWAIGCVGARLQQARLFDTAPVEPEGEFDSYGPMVTPPSLYLAQLEERLGPQAVRNIGYVSNSRKALDDTTLKPSPALRNEVDPEYGRDLAMFRPVDASNVRNNARVYGAEKALDGDPGTFWTIDDGLGSATFEVDMEGPVDIDAAVIREAAGHEGRISRYTIEGQVNSDWTLLSSGTTAGKQRVNRFPLTTVWKVRLTVAYPLAPPAISTFGLYRK